eukprot:6502294-Prymnesium_polylepis.2
MRSPTEATPVGQSSVPGVWRCPLHLAASDASQNANMNCSVHASKTHTKWRSQSATYTRPLAAVMCSIPGERPDDEHTSTAAPSLLNCCTSYRATVVRNPTNIAVLSHASEQASSSTVKAPPLQSE